MKKRAVQLILTAMTSAVLIAGCANESVKGENSVAAESAETGEDAEAPEEESTPEVTQAPSKENADDDEYADLVPQVIYSCADKAEGIELMMSNTEYYDGFSQNDLDFKSQTKGGEMGDYLEFAKDQVLDFTPEEIEVLDEAMHEMEIGLFEDGYVLPDLDPVVFIKTTQDEECGTAAYTHGTQIYIGQVCFDYAMKSAEGYEWFRTMLDHELFHCLTRSNPKFREDMYSLINFTVQDEDFEIPPSVEEYFISNPDVEHHNSYATFVIDGEEVDCFAVLVTTQHFENPGDSFVSYMTTGLVPIDGRDVYYTPEQTSNFDEVFGENTGYVIDPEECMADNFSYALMYGKEGPDGEGYPTQEIIDGIVDYLNK